MRALGILLIFVASSAAAEDRYEILSAPGRVDVRKGKRRGTIMFVDGTVQPATIDAKRRKVSFQVVSECRGSPTHDFTFDQLEARLANHEAVVLHKKQDWAGSAKGFAAAVKLDPAWPLAAYNLASAHARSNQLPAAVAALAPWLKQDPLATYIQVHVDPELQPLIATKELAAIASKVPGTSKLLRGDTFAYSADRNLVAFTSSTAGYLSCKSSTVVALVDAKTAKRVAEIPLEENTACGASQPAKDAVARRVDAAEKVLAGLGFAATPFEQASSVQQQDSFKYIIRLPKSKLGLVTNANGGMNVLRDGKTRVGEVAMVHERVHWAAYLPAAKLVVVESYWPSDMCAETTMSTAAIR